MECLHCIGWPRLRPVFWHSYGVSHPFNDAFGSALGFRFWRWRAVGGDLRASAFPGRRRLMASLNVFLIPGGFLRRRLYWPRLRWSSLFGRDGGCGM